MKRFLDTLELHGGVGGGKHPTAPRTAKHHHNTAGRRRVQAGRPHGKPTAHTLALEVGGGGGGLQQRRAGAVVGPHQRRLQRLAQPAGPEPAMLGRGPRLVRRGTLQADGRMSGLHHQCANLTREKKSVTRINKTRANHTQKHKKACK